MPKRTDIKTILIIGAGPIVIGQACEFDYSGAQACKALREEGYRVVAENLVNGLGMEAADLIKDEQGFKKMRQAVVEKNRLFFHQQILIF